MLDGVSPGKQKILGAKKFNIVFQVDMNHTSVVGFVSVLQRESTLYEIIKKNQKDELGMISTIQCK